MERRGNVTISFTEEEAYELLTRSIGNDEEDNAAFQSALKKLAAAITSVHLRAA